MATIDDVTAETALDFGNSTPGKPASSYARNPGTSPLMISSMLASGVSAIGGGISSYFSQKASGAYQESVANMNSKFAEFEGQTALYKGDIMASRRLTMAGREAGAGRAAFGASGASVMGGSPAAAGIEARGVGIQDSLMIRANAMRTALGYESEAANYTAQGQMAKISGNYGATASLITGGIQAISAPTQTYALYDRLRAYSMGGRV